MLRVDADPWATTQVALPEVRVELPPPHVRGVEPSLNVTVPVGVPAPGATAFTVAVYVTDCPTTDGFVDETKLVVDEDAPTACDTAVEDDAAYGADPAYAAVMVRVPADGQATTQVAVPELSVWLPPEHVIAEPPSRKTTEPVGVPDAAVTVAVRVTDWPTTDGFVDEVSEVVVVTVRRTVTVALGALTAVQPERTAYTV